MSQRSAGLVVLAVFVGALSALGAPAAAGVGAGGGDALVVGHRDGALDRSFGRRGLVATDLGGDAEWGEYASAVVVQPDGKIVAGGPVLRTAGDETTMEWTLVRYRRNGLLDRSFGDGGRVTTRFGGGWDFLSSLVLQPDGKIVAAGFAAHTPGGADADFALARYDPDGELDPTFGTGGLVTTDFGSWEGAFALALASDGRLLAAGQRDDVANRNFALARYDRDGGLDPTFGTGGRVVTDVAGGLDAADAVVALPDGRVVVAGASAPAGSFDLDFALARYRRDGTLDPTFGTGGLVVSDVEGGGNGQVTSLVRQPDGRLVAAGYAIVEGEQQMALARYTLAGDLDASFASDGMVTIDPGGGGTANAVVLQADGKPVVAGSAFGPSGLAGLALARFHRDGRVDRSFGSAGTVVTDFGQGGAAAYALAFQRDDRLVVAGSVFAPGAIQGDLALARFHLDVHRRNHRGTRP